MTFLKGFSRKLLEDVWVMDGDKPAVVVELKWDKSAEGAIAQIRERRYVDALKGYQGNILLAGINDDRKTKTHTCLIERGEKPEFSSRMLPGRETKGESQL